MRLLHLSALILLLGATAPVAAGWKTPPADANVTGSDRTLYYFRTSGTVLCREVEEDVWTDRRISGEVDRMHAYRIDADDPAMAEYLRRFKVFLVPTVVVAEDGKEIARLVRNASREDHLALLAATPGNASVTGVSYKKTSTTSGANPPTDPAMASVADAVGDAPSPDCDILAVAALIDPSALTIRLTLAGPPSSRLGAYNLFIDYDGDPTTGYSVGRLEGVDYLVQGTQLNKFHGARSTEWVWSELRLVPVSTAGNTCTFVLPIKSSSLQDFRKTRIFAQTQDDQWATVDEAPSLDGVAVRP